MHIFLDAEPIGKETNDWVNAARVVSRGVRPSWMTIHPSVLGLH